MKRKELLGLALKQVIDMPVISSNPLRYISDELGLVWTIEGVSDMVEKVTLIGQPYRLKEGRVVYFRSGKLRLRINLIERELCAGQLLVVSPGTVFEVLGYSGDFDLTMLAFANSFMENWQKEDLLITYMQGRISQAFSLDEATRKRMEALFALLWSVLHDEAFSRETVQGIISILFHQLAYIQKRKPLEKEQRHTRQEEVFNRFINLVNNYAIRERNVAFYADNLFLTSRYLSTLIREISGRTVMDWVNDAVIQEAKLRLCHTDKLVYEIAEELNFPNSSFFCKFFRRMTGKTPHAYRQEGQ